jgi:ABC-type xylose transport system permease subunit
MNILNIYDQYSILGLTTKGISHISIISRDIDLDVDKKYHMLNGIDVNAYFSWYKKYYSKSF